MLFISLCGFESLSQCHFLSAWRTCFSVLCKASHVYLGISLFCLHFWNLVLPYKGFLVECFFSPLLLICHHPAFCISTISDKNQLLNYWVPLPIVCELFFSCCFQDFVFSFLLFNTDYDVSQCRFLCVFFLLWIY